MEWKYNIRWSRKHSRRLPDETTGKSSDTPSALLRDQNPAAIVMEVIPLAYSNLKWDGAVRTMVACILLEHGRRFPLKTNAPN
jgi:hypothetical protein